jgi:hypothetical protein
MLLTRRVLLTSELTGRQSRDRMSASAAASGSENIVFSYSDLKEEGVRADHTCKAREYHLRISRVLIIP